MTPESRSAPPAELAHPNYEQSAWLKDREHLHVDGDPETEADFTRALNYLETMTAHFVEFGPWQEKTAWDIAYELIHHNTWH